MVILPFYQFLIAFLEENRLKYAFLRKDKQTVPVDISACFPTCHAETQTIYGILNKNGKDVIGRAAIKSTKTDFSPLFALSNKKISYTAVSQDNQKIAFLSTDLSSQETLLRVIAKEEFGWFPLPYVKMPAMNSPICFCSSNIVMYTDPSGKLKAVRTIKPAKSMEIDAEGYMPAYENRTGKRAFVKNNKMFIFSDIKDEIDVNSPNFISFSKNGKELLFTDKNTLYRYDLSSKKQETVFQSTCPIVFIAEI